MWIREVRWQTATPSTIEAVKEIIIPSVRSRHSA
jgi:hypothetical protein